jgi:hypothetical protein
MIEMASLFRGNSIYIPCACDWRRRNAPKPMLFWPRKVLGNQFLCIFRSPWIVSGLDDTWSRSQTLYRLMNINVNIGFIHNFPISKCHGERKSFTIHWPPVINGLWRTYSPINSSMTSSRVTTPRAPDVSVGFSDTRTIWECPSWK